LVAVWLSSLFVQLRQKVRRLAVIPDENNEAQIDQDLVDIDHRLKVLKHAFRLVAASVYFLEISNLVGKVTTVHCCSENKI